VPPAEQERKLHDFKESWPFAPHLLQLLEDQVLVATDAQETRDLIRILASLFKSRGEKTPILTSADFKLDDDATGIGALLDSVASQQHRALRDKARRNLTSVVEAVPDHAAKAPHLEDIVGALWLRSIAVGNLGGAEPAVLQADITKAKKIDDNSFQVELATIIENSFNIHEDGTRLVFKEEENPQAKVMASARNDKLFTDRSDLLRLAKEIRYVVGGTEEVAKNFRVIALPRNWMTDPWTGLDEGEHPDKWDERLPILVLPEEPDRLNETLGQWLRDHLDKRRNTVRFLLPRSGFTNAFYDRDLLILARAEMKAQEFGSQSAEYRKLQTKYQGELRDILKKRFDRFSVLHRWNFTDTSLCVFQIESLKEQGSKIPNAIEAALTSDLFVPEDFQDLVLEAANNSTSVGKLLKELQEPRPSGQDCIPWLGETAMKERIIRLCARGKVAINFRGIEYLQAQAGEDEDTAWKRLRSKLGLTGRQLDEVVLMQPSAVPSTGGSAPVAPPAGVPPAGGLFGGPGAGDNPPSDGSTGTGTADDSGGTTGPAPGGIFGGGTSGGRTPLFSPPTSPLNLIGKMEGWGIGPATPVKEVTLKVSAATGAQLKELLKKLPDGMTFEISLDKEDR